MTIDRPEGGTLHSDEPQSMAALLEEEDAPFTELRRGDIIEGTVVGTDRDAILVDIGAKSEGIIPPNEMNCLQPEGPAKLEVGEKVLVFVLQPESSEGQIILSLDRARGEQGWRVLQEYLDEGKSFEGYVTGSNKGGLLVNVEGVNAFVPLSQIASGRPERGSPEVTERALAEWVGRTLTMKVIELNRRRNRAIVSERAAVQEKRAAEKERLLQELEEGDVRTGRITSIRDFGIFVDVGGADGLVHLSELSWDRTPKSPQDMFKVGDDVEVFVLKVDQESKKIALSLRRAQPERWEEIVADYREGQIVPGQVTKLAPFGAFVRLDGPVEGLIHISELVDRRINHPKEVVSEDDVVPVKIVRIEHDRHRLGLSLRQARDKAEEDGWVFSEDGGVADPLPEALERLGVEARPKREPVATAVEPSDEPEGEPTIAQSLPEAAAELAAEAAAEEAAEEAASEEPAAEPEATEEPASEEPAAEPEAAEEAASEEPAAEPEATEEPASEEPAAEPEAVEEAASEEPAAEPEAAEEAASEEPTVEPEAAEEAASEEPAAEPEAAEEAASEEPAAEPEAAEEAASEEPAAEPEAAEEAASEEPAAESEAAEEAASEEPAAEPEAAEEAASEEPAAEPEAVEEAASEEPAPEPEAEEIDTESAPEEEPAVTDEASDALNLRADESGGEEPAEAEPQDETSDSEKDESSG